MNLNSFLSSYNRFIRNAKWLLICTPVPLLAQSVTKTDLPADASLESLIQFALENQATVQQSKIDEKITDSQIRSRLSAWYPQVNFNYNIQHNFVVQTSIIGGNPVKLGVDNTSGALLSLSQNVFNRDVLLAQKTKQDVRLMAGQSTTDTRINLVADVTKAFYDVLATREQVNVTVGDIQRLERSLKDTRHQYDAGVTDKIDYKRATIALNNTRAALKTYEEVLKAKIEYLKTVAGYPTDRSLDIKYDTLQMENEIWIDTIAGPDLNSRIEYQLLQTQKRLTESNLRYSKWSYLPSISLGAAYNFNYLSNTMSDLYKINRPNSYVNLTLSLPIFQGGKRKADIAEAELQLKRLDWDFDALDLGIRTEYQSALANYKGSLSQYQALKENMDLAKEIYDVVNLQYRSGIKTYLEVVTAETDLRQARINYFNALYQVMSGKIDVQKALGQLNY